MNKWMISRYKVRFKSRDVDVYSGFYDILAWIVQIQLDSLYLLGSVLLALQVMWRKLFPTSQQKVTNRDTSLSSEDYNSRTFTVRELQQYDGIQDERIYFAVNGKVFDATNTKDIQFLDGPFNCFAGRDASRALATFTLNEQLKSLSEMDDLSDLNPLQLDSLFHWEMQCSERYPRVGTLVRSHQPRALQHACIRTICTTISERKVSYREKVIEELPLPKILRNKILSSR